MNRIYQGKVTNVEIANPDKHAPRIGHRASVIGDSPQMHVHQLFHVTGNRPLRIGYRSSSIGHSSKPLDEVNTNQTQLL